VAQINQRSNSLFPYQLVEVLSAAPPASNAANPDHQELVLAVKRGDNHEAYAVTLKPAADGHYSLVRFAQQPQHDVTNEAGAAVS
jgi:hypothetical protein